MIPVKVHKKILDFDSYFCIKTVGDFIMEKKRNEIMGLKRNQKKFCIKSIVLLKQFKNMVKKQNQSGKKRRKKKKTNSKIME